MQWNFDMDAAPKGKTETIRVPWNKKTVERKVFTPHWVLTATPTCGKVIMSHWLPKENRWNGYTKENPPLAWMEKPKHPECEA